jgi:hypothetical protein
MRHAIHPHRISFLITLLGLALATIGGTCVVVEEEGFPGPYEEPGENEEVMLEQEEEAME